MNYIIDGDMYEKLHSFMKRGAVLSAEVSIKNRDEPIPPILVRYCISRLWSCRR